jgi:hypothetical protein
MRGQIEKMSQNARLRRNGITNGSFGAYYCLEPVDWLGREWLG